MYQQAGLIFYRFRFLWAGILAIALVVLFSVSVTAIGSDSILDPSSRSSKTATSNNAIDTPNMVTTSVYELSGGTKRAMLTVGTTIYSTCQTITNVATQTGESVVHGSAVAVGGVGSGVAFVGRGIGDGTMSTLRGVGSVILSGLRGVGSGILFTTHLPGKILGSIVQTNPVSTIIRPVDKNPVPIINTKPSAAILAHINVETKQDIQHKEDNANLRAAQLAANRRLDGVVVTGNSSHGGYPTAWNNAPQDSMLDSWGMYNRECVSYAAWKVYQYYGDMPYWGGVGNANQWLGDARVSGIPTGSVPKVHSVAISMRGYYGHAMWVEKVKGNMIYVSQYNYDLRGHYSEMWVNSSSFTYIYFK